MKITHDNQADAVYIKLTDTPFHRNQVINENVILDIDATGNVIGVELLAVSTWLHEPHQLLYEDITHKATMMPPK